MPEHTIAIAEVPNPHPLEAHIPLIQASCSCAWVSRACEHIGPVMRERADHLLEAYRAAR
jgi:hypothetical protein